MSEQNRREFLQTTSSVGVGAAVMSSPAAVLAAARAPQAMALPDGSLVRGSSGEIYLIFYGQRHLVPDFTSDVGEPSAELRVPQLSDAALYAIPEGPALESATIEASREDEVVSDMPRRYLATQATLSQGAARLDAWTRTWTRQPWFGFTGGVIVLYGNAGGEFIGNTDLIQFGVDGFRIPFKRWTREDWWTQPVPSDVAANTTHLEIVHTHAPRDRVFQTLQDIAAATRIIAEIVAQLRVVFA